jgi:arginine repressor
VAKIINITRDGYYKSLKKDEVKMRKDKELKELIKEIFIKSRFTYGYRRVTQALKDIGFKINRKKVSRIMKELGLKARASKKPINLENQKKKFYFILIEDHNTQVTSLKRN